MSNTQTARAAQALRNKRDAARPPTSKRPPLDASIDGANKKRRLNEPYVRDGQYILRKHKGKPPSFVIHLHTTHFRFDNQEGSFAYDSPMKFVLKHLRQHTVPHEMLEEMLSSDVKFYDGCLIVEVHNHRDEQAQKDGARVDKEEDGKKFSMDNYNEHITPSPFAPFPSKAQAESAPPAHRESSSEETEKAKGKEKEGPKIATIVLHPTELTRHEEMLILARLPASELKGKRKGSESGGQVNGQPPTPRLAVPATPIGSTSRGQNAQLEKKALDQSELYSFQAELLVATEPPLLLDPAGSAEESDAILAALAHPLHSAPPPSSTERKRTTAEMAAEDAQAAETERRMLIMDERIKPSARGGAGASTGDSSGAAASLGFSRFKTIEMVRQKHEEQDRAKKEEEARLAVEKRQYDEQMQQQQQQKVMAQRKQAELAAQQQQLKQRQMMAQQQAEMMKQLNAQQQVNLAAQHNHPAQNNVMQNQAQPNFQQHAGSPPRQQTPMLNSSPMLPQGGFPMAANNSQQGAGSPPRPPSAAMNHPMARNASQQPNGSRNNTPQIPQGTPSMATAVPNRNMSQTPRLQPGSPAAAIQGTPTPMMMPTPQMGNNNLTPEQVSLLRAQAQMNGGAGGQAGSPAAPNMNAETFQLVQRMGTLNQAYKTSFAQAQMAQAQGNMQVASQQYQRAQMFQNQLGQIKNRMALLSQQSQQSPSNMSAGSPGGVQRTPQLNHAHPGGQQAQQMLTPQQQQMPNTPMNLQQQQAAAQAQAQQLRLRQQQLQYSMQLQQLSQNHGGTIPPHVAQQLPPHLQQLLRQQQLKQHQMRAQAQARLQQQQQQQQHGGQGQAGQGQYMQDMNSLRAGLAMQMNQQQQQGGMNALGMNMGNMQQFGGQQSPQPNNTDNLSQQFAAMQQALNRQQQGMQ